jgi:membrane protein DedA with SNARE-associated domain
VTEALFGLVSGYGWIAVMASAFLSCLALPIPTAFVMLAAGGFAAAGDLALWQAATAAFAGAVAGDQAGFWVGRTGGARMARALEGRPGRAELMNRASGVVDRWGGLGVFFSTWLFAPLGPWVNLAAGAAGLAWVRFTLWDAVGEAIWVGFYLGMGFLFADRITELAALLGDSVGLLVAALAMVVLGVLLFRRRQRPGSTADAALEPKRRPVP